MRRKIQTAMLGLLVAVFAFGFTRVARAQDAGEMMPNPGAFEPDAKVPPIMLVTSSEWCGPQTDKTLGSGGFFISFKQNKYKLSGEWSSNVSGFQKDKNGVPGGTFHGKISKSDGTSVSLTLTQKGVKGGLVIDGHFINSKELTGSYLSFGRKQSDSGSVDPQQPCS